MTAKSAGAPSLLEEVHRQTELMGRYALETGLEFPGEGERLWGKMEGEISLEELTKLHRILAQRVAPATPLTLEATRGGSLTGRIREVAILKRLSAICLVSLGLFLLCLLLTSLPLPEWCRGVREVVPVFLASLLGSSFSALFTANRYVVARTFDPRYETTYWSRLWLGVVAGTLLALFVKGGAAAGQDSALLEGIGPLAAALLGGYSAEAVDRVLRRLAETLVVLVRGSEKERLESLYREKEIRAEESKRREELCDEILSLPVPPESRGGIEEALERYRNS